MNKPEDYVATAYEGSNLQKMWNARAAAGSIQMPDGTIVGYAFDPQTIENAEAFRRRVRENDRRRARKWLKIAAASSMLGVYGSISVAPDSIFLLITALSATIFLRLYRKYWQGEPERFYTKI